MALSLKKQQRLEAAGLGRLYGKHERLWRDKAKQAFEYTREFVKQTGNPVRQDDVLPLLEPVLEVSDELRNYLAEKRLTQQYWYQWFGEYVIDKLWSELVEGDERDAKNGA